MFEDEQLYVCSRQLMAKTFESLQWIVRELTRSAISTFGSTFTLRAAN